jgi:hypothetical protein
MVETLRAWAIRPELERMAMAADEEIAARPGIATLRVMQPRRPVARQGLETGSCVG